MRSSYNKAAALLCIFFILVFAISLAYNPHFPVLVISGEASVGTWMSGALLMMAATITLNIGMRQGWFPWFVAAVFFFLLALDERFMFHERMKQHIIFSGSTSRWVYELPVMLGACLGALMTFLLWQQLRKSGRALLLCATALGTASVVIDILDTGALWEDCFKLIAELLIVLALLTVIPVER